MVCVTLKTYAAALPHARDMREHTLLGSFSLDLAMLAHVLTVTLAYGLRYADDICCYASTCSSFVSFVYLAHTLHNMDTLVICRFTDR